MSTSKSPSGTSKSTRFFVIFCGPFLNALVGWLCKCHSRIGVFTWYTFFTPKIDNEKMLKNHRWCRRLSGYQGVQQTGEARVLPPSGSGLGLRPSTSYRPRHRRIPKDDSLRQSFVKLGILLFFAIEICFLPLKSF